MKKLVWLGLLAAISVALATPAGAISLLAGPMEAHFTDGSAVYVDDDDNPQTPLVPRAPQDIQAPGDPVVAPWADTAPQLGDENRSVIDVNQFLQNGSPYLGLPGGTLTGLMYDQELVRLDVSTNALGDTIFDLYYAPMGRNPLAPDADSPAGSGGVMELWLDPTTEGEGVALFDPAGDGLAPFQWVEGGGPGGRDAYPTVNLGDDSSLWLSAVFAPVGTVFTVDTDGDGVPDSVPVDIIMHETLNVTSGAGAIATSFLNIIGGSGAGMFDRNVFGPGLDISLASTLELPGLATYGGTPQDIGNWAIRSFDPVQADIIPEPMSLSLLGLGLLGLGARIRRRK